jgi:hypothetical protein
LYDALNRLSHKGYPDSTGVDYVYDLVGKIQQPQRATPPAEEATPAWSRTPCRARSNFESVLGNSRCQWFYLL